MSPLISTSAAALSLGYVFVDRLARRRDVLDHHHAVAVFKLVAKHAALVCAVVLDLFAVGTVLDLLAIELVQGDGRDDRQRNALVCGTEDDVEVEPKLSWMARA